MEKVEKRRRFIINTVYFAIILGIFYCFMRFAFWTCFPFIMAFFIAMALQRPVNWVVKKTPLKKGLVSGALVLLAVAVLIAVLTLIGVRIVNELRGFWALITAKLDNLPAFLDQAEAWILERIHFLPNSIEQMAANGIHELFQSLEGGAGGASLNIDLSMLSSPLSGVWNTAKQIPSVFLATLISIIACCFMTADYDRLVNFVKRQLPHKRRNALSTSKRLLFSSLFKMVRAYTLIILITFCEMALGLGFLKLIGAYEGGFILVIALLTALVDILPVLGTGTILIPWGVISLFMGRITLGIGLLVLYVIISVIRQIIEPKLVAGHLGLPPVATVVGMYIGLQLFGFIGIFLVPLTLIMLKLLNDQGVVHLWKRAGEEDSAEEVPDEAGEQGEASTEA
ncbi:MAG TPA: sporulation integral membrane protein YtvI [Candidatus Fimivicinus intestinavium]|nr:sporulation integral membrane protein YtvI [Candidatus Fimivicinus intestinavium]